MSTNTILVTYPWFGSLNPEWSPLPPVGKIFDPLAYRLGVIRSHTGTDEYCAAVAGHALPEPVAVDER